MNTATIKTATQQAAYEWIAPIRLAIAFGRSARAVDPRGAAFIFAVAWLAGVSGSVAGLAIAAALLLGLYVARAATIPAPAVHTVPTSIAAPAVIQAAPGVVATQPAPTSPADPLAQLGNATGLVVSQVTLKQPGSNGKAPKAAVRP